MRRDKYEGTISRTANGRYRIRIMINGHVFSHVSDNKSDLNKWRRDLLTQIDSGIRPNNTRLLLSEAFDIWLIEYRQNVSKTTIQNIVSGIRMWNMVLPKMRLAQLNKDRVQAAINAAIDSGMAPSTIRHRITVLSIMSKWAVDKGYILRKPTEGLRVPHIGRKVDHMVVDYAERVIDFLSQYNELMAARCKILYYTGMRVGEACGLMWSDVDFDRGQLTISRQFSRGQLSTPKTMSSIRTITLPDEAIGQLQWLKTQCRFEYVLSRRSCPLNSNIISSAVKIAADHLAIDFHTHMFRHAHASYLLHHGLSIPAVSARLGHNSIKTTLDVYSHVLPGSDDAVRELWKVKPIIKKSS